MTIITDSYLDIQNCDGQLGKSMETIHLFHKIMDWSGSLVRCAGISLQRERQYGACFPRYFSPAETTTWSLLSEIRATTVNLVSAGRTCRANSKQINLSRSQYSSSLTCFPRSSAQRVIMRRRRNWATKEQTMSANRGFKCRVLRLLISD